jgi:hypothetical protein
MLILRKMEHLIVSMIEKEVRERPDSQFDFCEKARAIIEEDRAMEGGAEYTGLSVRFL